LGWNSGLKTIPAIDLVQFVKKLLPYYKLGFEESTFVAIVTSFFKEKETDL